MSTNPYFPITEGEVLAALEDNYTPLMMATDIIRHCRTNQYGVDSHHPDYRHVLYVLHKLHDNKIVKQFYIPEANVSVWYLRNRVALNEKDIQF